MIDTKQLERILNLTRIDENTVHPAVRKIGKAPDIEEIIVVGIDTHSDSAHLRLNMEWYISLILAETVNRVGQDSAYRLKWFYQVIRRLHFYAKSTSIQFVVDHQTFEFGVRPVKDQLGKAVLWASVSVLAFENTEESLGNEDLQ